MIQILNVKSEFDENSIINIKTEATADCAEETKLPDHQFKVEKLETLEQNSVQNNSAINLKISPVTEAFTLNLACIKDEYEQEQVVVQIPTETTQNSSLKCDICDKIYKSKSNLKYHMLVHLKKVKCKICQAEVTVRYIPQHLKYSHGAENDFQCRFCDKTFKSKYYLDHHEKRHDKKFECAVCGRKFPYQSHLIQHQKEYHENPGSFSCEICDKKFCEKNNLRKHQKIHDKNRPKPIKCDLCSYATDEQRNLKSHLKRHEKKVKKKKISKKLTS